MRRTACILLGSIAALIVTLFVSAPSAFAATGPSQPQSLQVGTTTETTIPLTWSASSGSVDHYSIYRDGTPVATTTSTRFVDEKLWPHSTHTYYVIADDAAGNESSQSNLVTGVTKNDMTAPTAPSNLVAKFVVAKQIVRLTWAAATDNVKVDHYDILRNLTKIGSTDASTLHFTDTKAPLNTTVKYAIVAIDEFSNNSNTSNQPQVITDTVAPTTPANLATAASTTSGVALRWNPSSDNFSVVTYRIFRDGVRLMDQSAANGTNFYDSKISRGTSYTYRVEAIDGTGNKSTVSNVTTANTP